MKRWFLTLVLLVVGAGPLCAGNVDEGARLFGEGKYAEAVEVLKKEITENPTNAKAYLFLGSCCEKLEQWTEAASAWEKFTKLTENPAERTYGETRLKECRDRAAGIVPVEEPETPTTPSSPNARFENHGPVFQTFRSQHFIVMCKNRELGEEASREAERHLSRISSTFLEGREWPHVVDIRVHKNHTEYVIEAGTPQWSGGGYSVRTFGPGNVLRRIDLFALDPKGKYINGLLTKTLPHELTHLVLHEYFGERTFRGLPLALNEGLAMYVEEGTAVLYESQLAQAVKKGVYYKHAELFSMRRYPPNVGLFYAEAASATRYLIEHLSAEQFQVFLAEIRKGNDVNSSLQTAMGRTGDLLTAMETNWIDMLKKKADTPATPPKPPDKKPDKKPDEEKPPKTETKDDDTEDVIIPY